MTAIWRISWKELSSCLSVYSGSLQENSGWTGVRCAGSLPTGIAGDITGILMLKKLDVLQVAELK